MVSEAWDARRPVIASRAGGLSDRIKERKNGFSFLPGSYIQLADIMSNCIGNDDLWREVAEAMEDELSLDAAWTAHKTVIDRMLTGA